MIAFLLNPKKSLLDIKIQKKTQLLKMLCGMRGRDFQNKNIVAYDS